MCGILTPCGDESAAGVAFYNHLAKNCSALLGMNPMAARRLRMIYGIRRRFMHDQTQFVVGWGTLSLINAGLAQSKGRSGLVWWLASLLLGPVATFLIVVLDKVGSGAAGP
jgi:hypothetical protein